MAATIFTSKQIGFLFSMHLSLSMPVWVETFKKQARLLDYTKAEIHMIGRLMVAAEITLVISFEGGSEMLLRKSFFQSNACF